MIRELLALLLSQPTLTVMVYRSALASPAMRKHTFVIEFV